ncbi:hypothetical protein IFT73_01125 [Aeromicrobium sp. CFBP 8757]|uniref:Zn-ribbon domain-containing OB-fold protein n=1 Tax=Aeromicrobium sp. CFBP 8757 TaxID=2775288 RepID=UPI0017817FD9|nr:hypothetical protein [Aeromicrobium sp. CFBP 8757]
MHEPTSASHAVEALFSVEGTTAAPRQPALLGGRCTACGYTFFPMQGHGCEQCGSIDLVPQALTGRGRVISYAEVERHPDPLLPPPFTVVAFMTEDGVAVKALADPSSEALLRTGATVVTTLVTDAGADHDAPRLRVLVADDDLATEGR